MARVQENVSMTRLPYTILRARRAPPVRGRVPQNHGAVRAMLSTAARSGWVRGAGRGPDDGAEWGRELDGVRLFGSNLLAPDVAYLAVIDGRWAAHGHVRRHAAFSAPRHRGLC